MVNSIKLMLIYFYVRFPWLATMRANPNCKPPGHCFFSVWIYVGVSWPSGCGRCRALPVGLVQDKVCFSFINHWIRGVDPIRKLRRTFFLNGRSTSITTVKPFHETPSLEREINLSIPSFSLAVTNSSLRFRNKAPIFL